MNFYEFILKMSDVHPVILVMMIVATVCAVVGSVACLTQVNLVKITNNKQETKS